MFLLGGQVGTVAQNLLVLTVVNTVRGLVLSLPKTFMLPLLMHVYSYRG